MGCFIGACTWWWSLGMQTCKLYGVHACWADGMPGSYRQSDVLLLGALLTACCDGPATNGADVVGLCLSCRLGSELLATSVSFVKTCWLVAVLPSSRLLLCLMGALVEGCAAMASWLDGIPFVAERAWFGCMHVMCLELGAS